MITDVLRNFNLFVDGRGYAGKVEECNPPKLNLKTEEFRGGGMDAPVELDMGMDKLETDFSLAGYDKDALATFGLAPGKLTKLTLRGALVGEDGTTKPAVADMNGTVKSVEPGAWKGGEKSTLKMAMALRYYKLTVDGAVVHEIDIENMKRVINGEDQLQAMRGALGI